VDGKGLLTTNLVAISDHRPLPRDRTEAVVETLPRVMYVRFGDRMCRYQPAEVSVTLAMAVSIGWMVYLLALMVLGWLILRHNR
jgi:hypothetical protein